MKILENITSYQDQILEISDQGAGAAADAPVQRLTKNAALGYVNRYEYMAGVEKQVELQNKSRYYNHQGASGSGGAGPSSVKHPVVLSSNQIRWAVTASPNIQ